MENNALSSRPAGATPLPTLQEHPPPASTRAVEGPWPLAPPLPLTPSAGPPTRRPTVGNVAAQVAALARSVEELRSVVELLDGRERANQERLSAEIASVKESVTVLQSSQGDLREQLLAEVGGHIQSVFGFLNKIVQEGEATRLMHGQKFAALDAKIDPLLQRTSPLSILKAISPLVVLALLQLLLGAIQKGH